jgi:hypothetical protein
VTATRWVCPRCEREFDRARQAHTCLPGVSVDEWFRHRPAEQRAVFDAVIGRLSGLGDLHVDAVQVGVFLKAQRKFAELRPRAQGRFGLELVLPVPVEHPRIRRSQRLSPGRWSHLIVLESPDDVDDQLGEWLVSAYAAADRPA